MKHQTQFKHLMPIAATLGVLLLALISCTKKEEERHIIPKQQTGPATEVNYSELLSDIEMLQVQIRKNPADSVLHAKLVTICTDTSRGKLIAAGRGEPQLNARSQAIAQQAAQEAAYIDACQWIAYLLEWRKHPNTPEFGEIHAELPGARIVHKVVEANETRVLVETELP